MFHLRQLNKSDSKRKNIGVALGKQHTWLALWVIIASTIFSASNPPRDVPSMVPPCNNTKPHYSLPPSPSYIVVDARNNFGIQLNPWMCVKSLIAILHSKYVSYSIRVPQALHAVNIQWRNSRVEITKTSSLITELSPGHMPPQVAIATVTSGGSKNT